MHPELVRELAVLDARYLLRLCVQFHDVVCDACAGTELECPLCGSTFGRFLPCGSEHAVWRTYDVVGAGRRANALCPECLSFDRERLVYLYLQRETSIFTQPARVLHVAPERALMRCLRSQRDLDYISIDLEDALAMLRMDVTDLRFERESFDFVICNHVLEHVEDDRKAMSEIRRVLKRTGHAILQVPLSFTLEHTFEDSSIATRQERYRAFGQQDHVRVYGRDYVSRLAEAGLSVRVHDFGSEWPQLAARHGLIERERVYAAKPSRKPRVPRALRRELQVTHATADATPNRRTRLSS